jgi:histidine phosphotransferase ChpT
MPRRQVKLAYLMMLCAETALPMGGEVRCRWNPAGNGRLPPAPTASRWRRAFGPSCAFGPGAVGRPLRPAEVQFLALHELAEAMARTLNYVHDDKAFA